MADRFPPGFEFRAPPRPAAPAGAEFGLRPAAPEPEPVDTLAPQGQGFFPKFGSTPGGAATMTLERRPMPVTPPLTADRSDMRSLVEGGLSAGGEIAGAR